MLVTIALAAGLASSGRPAVATFPGNNGRIAFVRGCHIFVMNGDGSGVMQLTRSQANCDFAPAWSPDGERIAFTRAPFQGPITNGGDIWVVSADGSNLTSLTNDRGVDRDPAWSPDGAQIAFSSRRDGLHDFEIFVMDSDGGGPRQLTNVGDGYASISPSWSPDGAHIAFELGEKGIPSDICLMAADGDSLTNLTATTESEGSPDWSPDGSTIVFTHRKESSGNSLRFPEIVSGSGTVRSTNLAGGDLRLAAEGGDASWSPDGSKIAFVADVPQRGSGIFVTTPDGRDRTFLAEGDASPVWQPLPGRGSSSASPVPSNIAMLPLVGSSSPGCVPVVPGLGTSTPAPELPVGGGPPAGGNADLSHRQVALLVGGLFLAVGGYVVFRAGLARSG